MKALVLAAGKSTRIATVTDGLPKPLISVGGEMILIRTLKWLASNGITDIWINLHYKPDSIKSAVGNGSSTGTNLRFSMENEILGTAGAVRKLKDVWTSDFLVVYGDNILGFDIHEMLAQHRSSGAMATIAVFDWNSDQHCEIAGGRVVMDNDNNILNFTEGASAPDSRWVNAGVYALSPKICSLIPDGQFSDFGKDIFPIILKRNSLIKGFPIKSYCLAADTPEALAKANDVIKAL